MAGKHNLPSQPTPFIGRISEVNDLMALLDKPECRLATLVGPGGIGKTRLALEVAGQLADAFTHGVAFVSLASVSQSAEIPSAIVNALGIHVGDSPTATDALFAFLSQRHMLLLLDNVEHLLDGANHIIDMLAKAPNLKILTTSREVLNIQEEWVWPVRGLRFPEDDVVQSLDDYGALQLFIERAVRVQRDFSLDRDLDCAIEICRLVGGMPLALELAASWLKTLTCDEIVAEIKGGIDILVTNVRNIEERHRSIRTVFDYSWAMCTPDEQAVFRKLYVFRGGFEREAAAQVAGASLMTLTALVEKSMLWKLPSGRYTVHELLRQYAQEKLDDAGETDATRNAHMRAYADFIQERTDDIKGRRQRDALNEIDADFGNARSAWKRAITLSETAILDRMMEGIALFCDMRARYQVGEALLKQAMDARHNEDGSEPTDPVWNRLRARWIQVWILQERTPLPDAIAEQLQLSLDTANAQSDHATAALCWWTAGELNRFDRAQHHGIPAYEQALNAYEALDDAYYKVRVLRGVVHSYIFAIDSAQWDRMVILNKQHLESAREIGDLTGMAAAIYYDAEISLFIYGLDRDDGEARLREALDIWQAMGDRKSIGVMRSILGLLAWLQADHEAANAHLVEAAKLAQDVNFINTYCMAVANQGFMAMLADDFETGQALCRERLRFHRTPATAFSWNLAQTGLALAAVSEDDFQTAREILGETLENMRFPLELVLMLPIAAMVMAHDNAILPAVQLLGLAFTHAVSIPDWMENWPRLTALRDDLQKQLGGEDYQSAWQVGTQLDRDQARSLLSRLEDTETTEYQPLVEPLSERELEVLALIAEGFSNKEIADDLVLAVGTVKVHTRNIYSKLGAANRTEAAAIARKLNLISPD